MTHNRPLTPTQIPNRDLVRMNVLELVSLSVTKTIVWLLVQIKRFKLVTHANPVIQLVHWIKVVMALPLQNVIPALVPHMLFIPMARPVAYLFVPMELLQMQIKYASLVTPLVPSVMVQILLSALSVLRLHIFPRVKVPFVVMFVHQI